ncbi:aminoglycoside phosphotransferase [Cohnella endophytica]|uniref:Aminoglycoside phosphotransferase n=1 Tax=Cohnella endophytica TaxID=2419778 RepID=A0A494Y248_9BACL|nr:phosphotransferase [Cohnella endophytica]RKP56826.1 aminoglycoside phosphotransferase [Cohnella endophytica]
MSLTIFEQILSHYFAAEEKWTITDGLSGWNNTTRFVEADGRRWVLRIYETHKDIDKVLFEHEILMALNDDGGMSFRVPEPAKARDGSTVVKLTDGSDRLACLFSYIEGKRPEEHDASIAYAFGIATGQLSKALQGVETKRDPMYPPYYEMDSAHPLCTPDNVAKFSNEPPEEFEELAEALGAVHEAIRNIRETLPRFRLLPHQLIHGDINHSNALVSGTNENRIAAILDFEFCTRDLRVMEVAVIVSGLLNNSGNENKHANSLEKFLIGVGEQISFNREEVEAIPLLVELRMLDVFLHFLGRYWDGVDGPEVVREQTLSAYEGLKKLNGRKDELLSLGIRYLSS